MSDRRPIPITVSFTGSTEAVSQLIALASTVLEIDHYHHNDLPLALWHLLQQVQTILDLAEKNAPYNPWASQEWDDRRDDWLSVKKYCEHIAMSISSLLPPPEETAS